jgi:hypothetical protein
VEGHYLGDDKALRSGRHQGAPVVPSYVRLGLLAVVVVALIVVLGRRR